MVLKVLRDPWSHSNELEDNIRKYNDKDIIK